MGCSSDDQATRWHGASASRPNPLAGQSFFVDPHSPAAIQAARWRSEGRTQDAAAIERLAATPTAAWFTDATGVSARARSLTQQAARSGKSALLVAYYIPGRDCGSYSAGGAPSAASYRQWIAGLARGIGTRRAAVVLEPDAVAQAVAGCLPAAARAERYDLLRYAVRTLAARPRVAVYLDAGNPGWVRRPARLAGALRRAGVGAADGFALNVSNFYRTGTSVRYGRALSRGLGGAHFVVDTSRNGNGPQRADDRLGPKWCNPPGRAVGRAPSTNTGEPSVDAYMWVKAPGASDGSCRPGAPAAGQWWAQYALELVRNRP
jgi:endoglucanase